VLELKIGAALMTEALKAVDRDGSIAYLESSNPRNISLYERFGFEVIGEIQSGSSPVVRPMLRKAR
jgi:ribosomal protein S18 acetylase RimI-like enzyme